jgi:hypothetical protein
MTVLRKDLKLSHYELQFAIIIYVRVLFDIVRFLWYVLSRKREDSMIMTASKLRENIYNVLDRALETGLSVEIKRRGMILKIVPPVGKSKLANLKKHNVLKGDPQGIVHLDWSGEWKS